jgi:hypothetical protein
MSNIIKEYWNFDSNDSLELFKLGQTIELTNKENEFKKINDNEYEYIGNYDKYLFIIKLNNQNLIEKLIYKNNFPFPNFEFWDNDYQIINAELSKLLNKVDENYKGHKICVVYRDFFPFLFILT